MFVDVDLTCSVDRRYLGPFFYTNRFQFMYIFVMSSLNDLLQIATQHLSGTSLKLGRTEKGISDV